MAGSCLHQLQCVHRWRRDSPVPTAAAAADEPTHLLAEEEGSQHAANTPDVQGIVVVPDVTQQLRALVEASSNTHGVLLVGEVELRQAPIDQLQLPLLVVDQHVCWLDVTVHDALAVGEVQRLQELQPGAAGPAAREEADTGKRGCEPNTEEAGSAALQLSLNIVGRPSWAQRKNCLGPAVVPNPHLPVLNHEQPC